MRFLVMFVTAVCVLFLMMYTSTVTAKEFIDIDISGFGRNSDSDILTFRNCDVETFEIQTGDIKTPPNRASTMDRAGTINLPLKLYKTEMVLKP